MTSKALSILILLFCVYSTLPAQSLKIKLSEKKTLHGIMSEVNTHYENKPESWRGENGEEPRYIHWKRWEHYMSSRLGPRGEFVNHTKRNQIAWQNLNRSRTINSSWTFVGPTITETGLGRADRIAFHPTDPNTIYVGTSGGGLWRSINGGTNWTPLSDHITSLGISGIVVNSSNPNIIYILTGDGDSNISGFVEDFGYMRPSAGVLKSTNGGTTWSNTGELSPNTYVGYKLVQDPNDPNTLMAATSDGLYRTENGGNDWTQLRTGRHHDVEFKPGSSTIIYTVAGSTYRYSDDSGTTWNTGNFDFSISGSTGRLDLAVTPINSSRVYLLASRVPGSGQYEGLYRSTNSGQDFTRQSNTPNILSGASDGSDNNCNCTYDVALAVSSSNSNRVVTGGIRIWRSTDGGVTMNYAGGTHADIHDLAYNPLTGDVFAATDGGIYISTDDGENWSASYTGMEASQIYHMVGWQSDPDYLIAGLQDNGVKLRADPSSYFEHIKSNDGFDGAFPVNAPDTFYATENKVLLKFTEGGDNWTNITPGSADDWFGTVATHISDPDVLFVGFDDVYRSDNQGGSWTNTGASGTWALTTCPSNSNRVYTAGAGNYNPSSTGNVWRSDNLGDNWTNISDNAGFPAITSSTKVTDVAVRPNNSNQVWATIGGYTAGVKVYRSTNAGGSWTNMSGTLPDVPINCVAITTGGDAYIGTDIGVFYRGAAMTDWMPFDNHLPNVPVTDIVLHEGDNLIRAATFGRGVWKSNLTTTCPANLILFTTLDGEHYLQANTQITSVSDITGTVGTDVVFKAPRILLTPGFEALKKGKFLAIPGVCGEGGIPLQEEEAGSGSQQ